MTTNGDKHWGRWAMGVISAVLTALLGLTTLTAREQGKALADLTTKQAVAEERWSVIQSDIREIKKKLDRIEERVAGGKYVR